MRIHSLSYETPEGKRPMHRRDLARRVKKTAPAQRAALAARITRGEVPIDAFTRAQTALLTNLHIASVNLATNASDEDLAQLRAGQLSLNGLKAKRRRSPNAATDRAVVKAIINAGPERVLAILDALAATRTPTAAAAE